MVQNLHKVTDLKLWWLSDTVQRECGEVLCTGI